MWIVNYIILSIILLNVTSEETNVRSRQRRYLVFPPSTQWGVFATISIPLHPDTTVSVAWFFEANYYNVDNVTYFDYLLGDIETVSRKREGRSALKQGNMLTRKRLYTFIESMLEKHGYPGPACLFRAICESATSHFLHNGLLGDLLHLILTPSTSESEDDLEDTYYEAQYYGLERNCDHYTHRCPANPLEYISLYVEDILK